MTDREAYVVLNLISGIGPVRITSLVEACGSAAGIFTRTAPELMELPGIGAELAERLVTCRTSSDPEREFQIAEKGGVKIVTRADETYPERLRELRDAPLCLYVRGDLSSDVLKRSLAFVGTRNITPYGMSMARHLAESAVYSRWTTVSGLAIGVDTVVHSATLDAGGITVGVVGGGLARFHPQENIPLARRIIEHGGAVISEFPMTFSPTRHSFPMRNRVISGLTLGTLVVEAGLNSGSLITAAHALEQGRRIFAVPGNADSESSSGCNELIRKGAVLTVNFEHVLEEFDFLPSFSNGNLAFREDSASYDTCAGAEKDETGDTEALLTEDGKSVLDILHGSDPLTSEEISNLCGIDSSTLLSVLISLEMTNNVKRLPSGAYIKIR